MSVVVPDICKEKNLPVISMHRGASRIYPENTMASVKGALNIAAQYPGYRFFIELDLRTSACGVPVLMHDAHVERTTKSFGRLDKMQVREINALEVKPLEKIISPGYVCRNQNADSLIKICGKDFCVPHFEDVLNVVNQANTMSALSRSPAGLAIDIKPEALFGCFYGNVSDALTSVMSSLVNRTGLNNMSERICLPARSVTPLAQIFNRLAPGGIKTPLIVFSSAGAAGKRDLALFWQKLESQSRKLFCPDIHEKGHIIYSPQYSPSLAGRIITGCANALQNFSCLGNHNGYLGLKNSLKPTFFSANNVKDIRAAIASEHNWISTNYPERVITAIDNLHAPL